MQDFQNLWWLEGDWRDSEQDGKNPFYERYSSVDDDRIEMQSFKDAAMTMQSFKDAAMTQLVGDKSIAFL